MSYSFSVTTSDLSAEGATLGSAIADKIADIPEGPGKDEASAMSDVIETTITALLQENTLGSAAISGSASSTSGYFSVSVSFATQSEPEVEKEPDPESS